MTGKSPLYAEISSHHADALAFIGKATGKSKRRMLEDAILLLAENYVAAPYPDIDFSALADCIPPMKQQRIFTR